MTNFEAGQEDWRDDDEVEGGDDRSTEIEDGTAEISLVDLDLAKPLAHRVTTTGHSIDQTLGALN